MDKEERTRMKQQRAAALHHKVQQERARAAGRDRAAVEACKQAKWMTSQVDRFGLLQDIDHTRQKTKQQIDHKVRMAKQTSAGRIAAARAMLLEKNKQARREEAEKQQFALNEKARRLAVMQQEHAKQLSRKFVMAPTDFEASQQYKYSPIGGNWSSSASLLALTLAPSTSRAGRPFNDILAMGTPDASALAVEP